MGEAADRGALRRDDDLERGDTVMGRGRARARARARARVRFTPDPYP